MAGSASAQTQSPAAGACPPLLQQTFNRLQDEKPQSLCQYAGKVLLVVNTASFCGFTPQYEGLEALHAKYASRGLVVMGFPSNDFGQQEPGGSSEIANVCFNTYGVRFPMFSKVTVVGKQAHPFFVALAEATGKAPALELPQIPGRPRGQAGGELCQQGGAGRRQPGVRHREGAGATLSHTGIACPHHASRRSR